MIRLENNTPSVYTEQSRDFQLFCRLYDCINNGVKFDIDSIININNSDRMNSKLLLMTLNKLGFYTHNTYEDNVLRKLIKTFPYLLKNKGSKKAIESTVDFILKLENIKVNKREIIIDKKDYNVNIYLNTTNKLKYTKLFDDIFKYILPAGFVWNIQIASIREFGKAIDDTSNIVFSNMLNTVTSPTISSSQIIGTDRLNSNTSNQFTLDNNISGKYFDTVGISLVVGSDEASLDTGTYSKDNNKTARDNIDSKNNIEILDNISEE